jgi:hypothetical protein
MTSYIDWVLFALPIGFICYSLYEDRNNSLWNQLASSFPSSRGRSFPSDNSGIEMVFFWLSANPEKYDYFNSLKVIASDSGLAFLPILNHLAIKPVLIPWSELKMVGSKRFWLKDRLVLNCGSTGINIAVLDHRKLRIQERLEEAN